VTALLRDVRYAWRMLAHAPGLATVAILTLALGIGANAAIFSLIDAVMLRTLPVSHPGQLVMLQWRSPKSVHGLVKNHFEWGGCPETRDVVYGCAFSYDTFRALSRQAGDFIGLFGFAGPFQVAASVNGRARLNNAELVSGDYFSTLGVHAMLGRTLGPEDDRNGSPVAVISYKEWQKRFGGNPAVVGQSVTIGHLPVTIVGVAAPEFFGLQPGTVPDFWFPLHLLPQLKLTFFGNNFFSFSDQGAWWLQIAGQRKSGVTADEAVAQAGAIFHRTVAAGLGSTTKVEIPRLAPISLSRGLDSLRHSFSKPLGVLMTLVGLVLLIACVNVAGLLLARAAGREKETSIRVALGASRGQLTRQFLIESLVLSVLGGAAGWFLALWGTELLRVSLSRGNAFSTLGIGPDWRVLGFTLGVSLVAGLLAGIASAFRAGHTDVSPALKAGLFAGGRGHGGSRYSLGLGKGMVVAQIAVALMVICAAGLFVRTLINLEDVRLGFNARHLLLFQVHPDLSGYKKEQERNLYKSAQQRLSALPGVRSVSWSNFALISDFSFTSKLKVSGHKYSGIRILLVGPRFFETMGIPVLLGRGFGFEDGNGAAAVAVVNEAFARKIGNADPVGFHSTGDFPGLKNPQIVGVVGNTRYSSVREPPPPTIYLSDLQGDFPGATFEVRTAGDPSALVPAVRQTLARLAPDVPLTEVRTQTDQVDRALSSERDIARLSSFFALLALLLACIGLYGLVSYSVARRTNEIGLRMALGAAREEILRMVLGMGAKLAAAGILIGVALSLALTRLVAGMLYGVHGGDPLTLAVASGLLAFVALAACYVPARRGMRVDPATALREE
jgi:macrolide transport system ATP-binding/permease protein